MAWGLDNIPQLAPVPEVSGSARLAPAEAGAATSPAHAGLSTVPPPTWEPPGAAAGDPDPLTGLPRASGFLDELALRVDEARDSGQPLSILLVEVDDLEALVREHGAARGDELVRHVANVVVSATRAGDHAARLGDDTFGVLLGATAPDTARRLAGRIRAAVESLTGPISWAGLFAATVTIGLACFPADADAPAELLRRAAAALAEARRIGRNRVWCYTRRPRIPLAVPVFFDGPSRRLVGTGRDLSNSGLLLESSDDLALGTRVALSFRLPGQQEAVRVIGRVVRRVPRADGDVVLWRLGVEFERYHDEDRWRVEAFLHSARIGHA